MLPWYKEIEKALQPIEGHTTFVLLALAGVTIIIALKGDAVAKMAWLVYLISP